MDVEITTERLLLRPLMTGDAEALYKLRSHELVHQQMLVLVSFSVAFFSFLDKQEAI
jgi:hypothetical protein